MPIQVKDNEINHQWSILCDQALVNPQTNLLSLLNTIEEITVSNLAKNGNKVNVKDLNENEQIVLSKIMSYVVMWRKDIFITDSIDRDIILEWISPNGKVLQKVLSPLKIEKEKRNLRMIFNFDKIIVTVPGTYVIRLSKKSLNDKNFTHIIDTPIDIKFV